MAVTLFSLFLGNELYFSAFFMANNSLTSRLLLCAQVTDPEQLRRITSKA
jgi:hypothetical protein